MIFKVINVALNATAQVSGCQILKAACSHLQVDFVPYWHLLYETFGNVRAKGVLKKNEKQRSR